MQIAVGDTLTSIKQTNGVRQGSPDSPILFSRIVADCLEGALRETSHLLRPAKGPPPPESGGAFMDDTYLWSHDPVHLQALLGALERRLAAHGLLINPAKTAIIHSQPGGGRVCHRGEGGGLQTLRRSHHCTGVTHHLWRGGCRNSDRNAPSSKESIPQACKAALRPNAFEGQDHTTPNTGAGGSALGGAILASDRQHPQSNQQHSAGTHTTHDAPSAEAGESWEQWNIRTMRGARVALHQSKVLRWSTFQLDTWREPNPGGDPCWFGRTSSGGRRRSRSRGERETRTSNLMRLQTRSGNWWPLRGQIGSKPQPISTYGTVWGKNSSQDSMSRGLQADKAASAISHPTYRGGPDATRQRMMLCS